MVKIFKNLQKLNRKFIKKKIQQYIAFHYCECLAIGKRLGKIEETVKKQGWDFAHRFSVRIARFCPKMSE